MNLIIEQGNSATKVAVFDHGDILISSVYQNFNADDLRLLIEKYPLVNGVLSTVAEFDDQLIVLLKEYMTHFFCLDEQTQLPITIQYSTPTTLGKDRIAAVVGANYLQPDRTTLVIDAGTAITYEIGRAHV